MSKKELFTDNEGIEYFNQIKFPCLFCGKIIPDWRLASSSVGNVLHEDKDYVWHKVCLPNGMSVKDVHTFIHEKQEKPQEKYLTDATLQSQPDMDQEKYDLSLVILSLQERPKAKREICNDTNLSMNTVSWRIYDNDTETPEFTKKGAVARHSETFIKVGNKSGKIRGFVYALMDKQYSEEVIRECREKFGITFLKGFNQ